MAEDYFPLQDKFTLSFKDKELEKAFRRSYDKSVRLPLRLGIVISILSWYSAISLIYFIIPDQFVWLGGFTFVYIGSYFGFIIYATYDKRFAGYYHLLGAISNAWAGLYTIYFCSFFSNGSHLILPVIIFIIFFGSYMIRLRWLAGFLAALSYIASYQVYILFYSGLSFGESLLYSFVCWMVLVFALLAGRTAENNYRIAYVQRKTIRSQNEIIEHEKELLLKEVHHRVQNNLQMIVSLINLQLRKMDERSPINDAAKRVTDVLCLIQGRVVSMSLVHQRIHQSSNFSNISVLEYTNHLKDSISKQYQARNVNVVLDIPDSIQFKIESAIPLGLILNEMITAVYESSVDSEKTYQVRISAEIQQDDTCKLSFQSTERTFDENHSETLEFELIEALTEQLDGKVRFSNEDGAKYELWLRYH